jgi:hypothetical protein
MAENEQIRQGEAARQAAETRVESTAALCKHCGAALEPDLPFCPNCGEKIEGEERTCEYCQTRTSKEFCPHCGRRVIPVNCPKCGTPSTYDACENCGAILNPTLEAVLTQEAPPEPKLMSAEEAAKIEAEFKALEQNELAEFKEFQKKLIERQILLEERDYFTKREKRIIKAFGSRPLTLELPDPQEESFRMKAYAGLEKTVVERDRKAIEAELEKMFPTAAVKGIDAAEMERNLTEMEKRFNAAAAKVENELEAIRLEEERKRLEEYRKREAERKRQIEIERRRLEKERRQNRINGIYYYYNNDFEMTLQIAGQSAARADYHCFVCGRSAVLDFTAAYDGANVKLHCSLVSNDSCGFTYLAGSGNSGHNDDRLNFTGRLNDTGTMLTGYWGNGSGSFRSQYFRGADSDASSGTFYKR